MFPIVYPSIRGPGNGGWSVARGVEDVAQSLSLTISSSNIYQLSYHTYHPVAVEER